MYYTVCSKECVVYSVQYRLGAIYSVQYRVCSIQCELYSVQYILYSIEWVGKSLQNRVYIIEFAVYSVQYKVCSLQCAVKSVQYPGKGSAYYNQQCFDGSFDRASLMSHITIQYSYVQCSAIQCRTIQCNYAQCSAVAYSAVRVSLKLTYH